MVISIYLPSKMGTVHWGFVPPPSLFLLPSHTLNGSELIVIQPVQVWRSASFSRVHECLGDLNNWIHIVHSVSMSSVGLATNAEAIRSSLSLSTLIS